MSRRGTDHSAIRGSSYDRRRRRKWIIEQFARGRIIPCAHCGRRMRVSTSRHPLGVWEVDRYPVCGHRGGRYVRGNIVPSCARCNRTRCSTMCLVGAVRS